MVWITLSSMDLLRAAYIHLLWYIIPTKVSQFSVLTAPFPLTACECPVFEIAMDWHLAAFGGKQPFKHGTSWGEGWGRNVDLLRNLHSILCLLWKKKTKLFPPSMLPQSVQVLKFKCPALGAINKAHFWVLPGHLLQLSPHQAHLVIASLHHSLSCLKWTCQSWKWSFLPCVKADTGMDGQSYIVGSTAILSGAA